MAKSSLLGRNFLATSGYTGYISLDQRKDKSMNKDIKAYTVKRFHYDSVGRSKSIRTPSGLIKLHLLPQIMRYWTSTTF
jgi:hypothetical protein